MALLIGMTAKSGKFGVIPDAPEPEYCEEAKKDETLCDSCRFYEEPHGCPTCCGDHYEEKENAE